ncbi:hypothetical protein GCM10023319_78470 [Nocardia iowensis]
MLDKYLVKARRCQARSDPPPDVPELFGVPEAWGVTESPGVSAFPATAAPPDPVTQSTLLAPHGVLPNRRGMGDRHHMFNYRHAGIHPLPDDT